MQTRKIYFNNPQLEYMYTGAHTSVIVGGRRLGKSHGFAAPYCLRNTQYMPRSTGGVIGSTFQQLLTRTLPGTIAALEDMGYKRDIHFYVGTKAPKSSNFQKPYIDPPSYDHSIIWYNGTIWRLISQDRPGTSNSLTLDWLLGDEAKLLNFDKLKDETFPANGGFRGHHGHIPWHHSQLFITDMPTTKKGSWVFRYQEQMDPELIDAIHGLQVQIYRLKQRMKENPRNRHPRDLKTFRKQLAQLQSVAVYYREWSSIENIQVLGEKYIRQMKRDLPPLVFQASIMSIRVKGNKGGFYPGLKESLHYYTAFNNSYLDSLGYNLKVAQEEDCRQDGDLDFKQPICVAFDYNANINWIVAGQRKDLKMLTLSSMHVKYENKLRELVRAFCKYYRFHQSREVVYYYDNTALGNNYAVGDDDFAKVVCDEFNAEKWTVYRKHIGNPMRHNEKHRMINDGLTGQKYLYPQFNQPNNEALLLAMENTGIKVSSRGFQKDKSGEKLAESEEDLLEHRTDGTDAWDTLFIGMNLFPFSSGVAGTGFSFSK